MARRWFSALAWRRLDFAVSTTRWRWSWRWAARSQAGRTQLPAFVGCTPEIIRYNHRLMLKAAFKPIIDWYMGALAKGGYPLIALLMAIESSIVPLPSEVVIPPAAHLAYTGQIPLSLWGVVVAGTLGSWLGATIMYWASRVAGRPLVMRYGRYFFVKPEKIEGAERWAAHYGSMGIFMSRLLPVVRHLIGIPAGIVRMNFWKYSFYTVLGSAIWCAVLCYLGVKMGQDEQVMAGELHRISYWIGGVTVAIGALYYVFVHRHMQADRDRSPG